MPPDASAPRIDHHLGSRPDALPVTAADVLRIRDAMAACGDLLRDRKVASLHLIGPSGADTSLHPAELGLLVSFDYDRAPTLFDLTAVEEMAAQGLGVPVHAVSAGGYAQADRTRVLKDAIRVF
ncbi:MAG: hypothetical protein RLY86_1778 [Pseudomonadota bacterium]|jgi:hypothetical protein